MALDFKGRAAANAWKEEADTLSNQAEAVMRGVEAALNEINAASRGGMVDELMINGSQMVEATSKMVGAFANLVSAVDTILDLLSSALGVASDLVLGNRGKMGR